MKVARIAVLGVALAAGGGAALMMGGGSPPDRRPAEGPAVATTEVLVATADVALGQGVKPTDLRWQTWPAEMVPAGAIKRSEVPNGLDEFVGATVRIALLAGEPVRREKIIKGQ